MDIKNLGAIPAPVQPQPQPQYSSEAQMNQNAGIETARQITLSVDNEAFKILTDASGLHAESIVNLGIKLFAKTNIYKEFMLKPDFKTLSQETEDLQSMVDISAKPSASPVTTKTTNVSSAAAPAAPAGGFASW